MPILKKSLQSRVIDLTDHEIKNFWLIRNQLDHKTILRNEKLSNKFFQSGKKNEIKKMIRNLINSAEKEIYLCSFIISDR